MELVTTIARTVTVRIYDSAATKGIYHIAFPSSVANGAQVWVSAAWATRRGKTGPLCTPITTNVAGGGTSATAKVKLAA